MRTAALRPVLALALAAVLAGLAAAPARAGDEARDDAPPPAFVLALADDDLEAARRKWAELSPEKRDRLRRAFERFRDLPEDKQAAFRERLQRLGGPEAVKAIRSGLERSPDRVRRHMKRMGETLERVERHVVENVLDDAGRDRWAALDDRARHRARRHLMGVVMMWGRDHVLAKYGTDEERATLEKAREGGDRETHHRIFKAIFERGREGLLGPHATELEALDGEDRERREMEIHVEALLRMLDARPDDVRAAVDKAVTRAVEAPSERGDRWNGKHRRTPGWGAFRMRDAGEDTKAMLQAVANALKVMPGRHRDEARRRAFQRIAAIRDLPDAERPAALRELLQGLLREKPRTPKRSE